MGDFKDLRQISTVQEYVDLFNELLTRVDLPEHYVVSCFVRGLKPEIISVKMLGPRTLAKAISLAKIQEQTFIVPKQVFHGILPNPKNMLTFQNATPSFAQNSSSNFKPHQITSKPSHSTIIGPKTPYKNVRILTSAEMNERRSKGLCFNCDEK